MRNVTIKFKKRLIENKLFYSLLLVFFCVTVLFFLVFSFIIHHSMRKKITGDVYETAEQLVDQAYNAVFYELNTVYQVGYQLFYSDNAVIKVLYAEENTQEELYEAQEAMVAAVRGNSLIDSIYLMNKHADLILTNDRSSHLKDFSDSDILNIINSYSSKSWNRFVPRVVNKEEYISFLFVKKNESASADTALVVNLNSHALKKIITDKQNYNNSVKIVNYHGKIIFSSVGEEFSGNISQSEMFRKIRNTTAKEGRFSIGVKEESQFVSYRKSDALNFIFLCIMPEAEVMETLYYYQRLLLLLCSLFFILGLFFVYSSIYFLYQPIRSLLEEIKQKWNQELHVPMDESSYLSHTYNRMTNQLKQARDTVERLSVNTKQELIRQLILGEFRFSLHYDMLLEQAGVNFIHSGFAVILLLYDDEEEVRLSFPHNEDIALYRYAIGNIACEVLERYVCETFTYERYHVGVVINHDGFESGFYDALTEIISVIDRLFHMGITICVSDIQCGVENISEGYEQVNKIAGYQLTMGGRGIVPYGQTLATREFSHGYPVELEKKIRWAAGQQELAKTNTYVNEFFDHIRRGTFDFASRSIYQLLLTISTAEQSGQNPMLARVMEMMQKKHTLCKKQEVICQYLTYMIESNRDSTLDKKTEILTKIITYVNNNYTNANLGTDDIAAHVSLSNNYIRGLFKEMMARTLWDYLIEVRIEKAKELLENPALTAKEISHMVGYTQSKYFYTVFKKHVGMTTEEYRKSPDTLRR